MSVFINHNPVIMLPYLGWWDRKSLCNSFHNFPTKTIF